MGQLTMTKAEREAFLAETRIAVITVAEAGRGPLAVPLRGSCRHARSMDTGPGPRVRTR